MPFVALRGTLTVEVAASGPTRVLVVSDSRSCSPPLFRGVCELEGCVELPSLGVSVIDDAPQELCYLSMRRISLDVLRNAIDKSVDLRVGSIQMDNSLPATAFPVLFTTQPEREKESLPAVHVSLCKGNAYSEMSYYRYLGFAIQPCVVKFDECTTPLLLCSIFLLRLHSVCTRVYQLCVGALRPIWRVLEEPRL